MDLVFFIFRLAFDIDGQIAKALAIIKLYDEEGIAKERVLIKLPSTWEGIEAARLAHLVKCIGVFVYYSELTILILSNDRFVHQFKKQFHQPSLELFSYLNTFSVGLH